MKRLILASSNGNTRTLQRDVVYDSEEYLSDLKEDGVLNEATYQYLESLVIDGDVVIPSGTVMKQSSKKTESYAYYSIDGQRGVNIPFLYEFVQEELIPSFSK